ncbi:MAG: methylenetetrahydrofolate reductase [NAD(P)H] [Opitutales bacterium]|nr:methylenetetrahydrofolate reductase [NAD(P)H] [Opitutales bacterium]
MQKTKTAISAEFFPPKTEEGARQILRAANAIKNYPLDFVSITYGAGGSSRERTIEYGELLAEIFNFEVMPHLTCVGHSVDELRGIISGYKKTGFKRVMALRGDPPKNEPNFKPHPNGLSHASELVSLIKSEFPEMKIACAGYPEKHPEAPDMQTDLQNLKRKIGLGADMIITQLFFDNRVFFDFAKSCQEMGIAKPVHAGVMPALSLKQARSFCAMCGSTLPKELEKMLESANSDEAKEAEIGLQWAKAQIADLMERGADGIHLYILNRPNSAIELMKSLFC